MTEELLYLKQNVLVEPLFDSWYAWSHLISPATAALNIYGRHLKIMDSYIMAPDIHKAAVANPKMIGGPFMDYPDNQKDAITGLKLHTLKQYKHLVQFANDVHALSSLLEEESDGTSLDGLYARIPDTLRGFVELTYDVRHHPSFRFFESILYNSKYYQQDAQSIRLSLITSDYRPFVLSTPRLKEENTVSLSIPFSHGGIDKLAAMKRVKGSYQEIKEELGVLPEDEQTFRTFFTSEPTENHVKFDAEGVRVRYFGHACILVETRGIAVLSDPVISYGYDTDLSRYTYKDLPEIIDYVIITHNHQDHILLETMLQIRHKVKTIVIPRGGNGALPDPNLKLMFKAIGFNNVIELDEMDELKEGHLSIMGLPFLGEHCDLNIMTKVCYLLKLPGVSMIFAADSCNVSPDLYRHIRAVTGDIDILFLGMECDGAPLSWLYGPYIMAKITKDIDMSRRLAGSNYQRGIEFVNTFNPKNVFVYAMGQEPWLNHIMAVKYTDESNPIIASNQLLKECRTRGIESERFYGEKNLLY
jgi:L-ascorbate metabolism protein UlaG (beta-lactamase superfamily)